MVRLITNEPAVVIGFVVALITSVWSITVEQQEAIRTLIEAALYLIGSIIIRQNVTPVAKLQGRP